jgi:hypothetical protein
MSGPEIVEEESGGIESVDEPRLEDRVESSSQFARPDGTAAVAIFSIDDAFAKEAFGAVVLERYERV